MRASSFIALLSATFAAAAPSPAPSGDAESYVLAGPLPYEELKAEVAKLKSDSDSNVARSLNKRICEGVYIGNACEATRFSHQIFRNPGGNLAAGISNNMGCFYCNPN
ncbi:hypothetical protein K4K60_000669 [Colletotrichum sp. SAR11_57]|nr:hypothetical protein K4K60_000669 [Colletotrichum sp. SAR11_57]